MCGIVAWHQLREPIDEGALNRAAESLAHRGPDGSGVWISASDGDTNQLIWNAVAFKDGAISGPMPDVKRYDSFLTDRYDSHIIAGWKKAGERDIEFFFLG